MGLIFLVVHLLASLFMLGVIWFVQIIHYPLFRLIPDDIFGPYEAEHMRLILSVVTPMMFVETLSGFALLFFHWPGNVMNSFLLNLALLFLIWLSTFLLQVPAHFRLRRKKNEQDLRLLLLSNWLRVLLWSARSVLLMFVVFQISNL